MDNRPGRGYRSRTGSLGQASLVRKIVAHPFAFGIGAGMVSGLVAAGRAKRVSIRANLITGVVVGIAELLLVEDRDKAIPTMIYTMLGHVLGLAPFTRWTPGQSAWIERGVRPVRVVI